jgi:nucleoside-diphosphate-sugar epimerase
MSTQTAAALSTPKKVAIVGSTGNLGRRALDRLLDRKIPVKCLIRQSTPPDFLAEKQKANPDLIEFVTGGDVTNPEIVQELLKDCTHCLALHGATRMSKWYEPLFASEGSEDSDPSHAKQVNCKSMETFVKCAQTTDCKHIVRITGKGETPWSFFSVLINGLGSMAKGWNYEGEQVLRKQQTTSKDSQHHLDYTIVRPGVMKADYDYKKENVHLDLADNGGDLPVSAVSYDQIAELCVEALFQPEARNTTLTAMNVANEENKTPPTITERLKQVKKDTRIFPSSLIEEHKRAVKTVFRSLTVGFLAVFAGAVFKLLQH